MALQGVYVDRFGVTHEQAYAKISFLNINMIEYTGDLIVNIWHDQDARNAGKEPLEMKHYMLDSQTFNTLLGEATGIDTLFVPIYNYLKERDFTGWSDV